MLGLVLMEPAFEEGTDEHLFHEGRALASYEMVSTLIVQAEE